MKNVEKCIKISLKSVGEMIRLHKELYFNWYAVLFFSYIMLQLQLKLVSLIFKWKYQWKKLRKSMHEIVSTNSIKSSFYD